MSRLKDKVVLITGSTTGIGEAIARRAVAEGAKVLSHGRDEKRGKEIVAELGDRAALHVDDIADPQALLANGGGRDSRRSANSTPW